MDIIPLGRRPSIGLIMRDIMDARLPDPVWVSTATDFQEMLDELLRSTIVAVDTESNSLFAYHERVCLVQISTQIKDYLVDPLVVDIKDLHDLFSSTRIEKVFHAAEYDIICLRRDYQFTFSNIFDTMIASRLLKKAALGLGACLEEDFGVTVDKRHQRADWGERPIKESMLEYARMDTHFLIPLRELRAAELKSAGLWELAQEDFRRLAASNGSLPVKPDCWSVAGKEKLEPQQMAVLQGLVEYRKRVAELIDRPVFKVMSDQSLVALARALPQNRSQLDSGGALSDKQLHRYGHDLLSVIRQGKEHPIPRRKPNHRPSEEYLRRYEKLKRWRVEKATGLGLESDVILPKDIMRGISDLNEVNRRSLQEVMQSTPWRFKQYGTMILKLLEDKEQKGNK
jgi:ribonuclease D